MNLERDKNGKVKVPVSMIMEARERIFAGACSIAGADNVTKTETALRWARELHRGVFGYHDNDVVSNGDP